MEGLTEGQREHLTTLTGLLDKAGLLELRGMVDDRLAELEGQEQGVGDCAGNNPGPAPPQSGSRGYVELKMIKNCGPYAYRRWREGGRLRSEYLGKVEVAPAS